jgi:hypothetical protein
MNRLSTDSLLLISNQLEIFDALRLAAVSPTIRKAIAHLINANRKELLSKRALWPLLDNTLAFLRRRYPSRIFRQERMWRSMYGWSPTKSWFNYDIKELTADNISISWCRLRFVVDKQNFASEGEYRGSDFKYYYLMFHLDNVEKKGSVTCWPKSPSTTLYFDKGHLWPTLCSLFIENST